MTKIKSVTYYKNGKNEFKLERDFTVERHYKYDIYIKDKESNKWISLDSLCTQLEAEDFLKELDNEN